MKTIIDALHRFRTNESISTEEMANFLLVQFKLGTFEALPEKAPKVRGRKKKVDSSDDATPSGQEA